MNHGDFKLTFGKYKDQTLNQIAASDEGLRYLDWFVGEVKSPGIKTALKLFLDNQELSRRLEELLDDG